MNEEEIGQLLHVSGKIKFEIKEEKRAWCFARATEILDRQYFHRSSGVDEILVAAEKIENFLNRG